MYAINDASLESIMSSDNTKYLIWSALNLVMYTLGVSYARSDHQSCDVVCMYLLLLITQADAES